MTLIELSCVLAVLAILTAAAVPASEAPAVLEAIAHAELRHFRDQGRWLPCPRTGEVPTGPVPFPAEEPCWSTLAIRLDGHTRFRYGVVVEGDSFVATAEGDLDRDGTPSRYRLGGHDLLLHVEEGLE
jgi:prepilin-type N-terminal cleavage/methylation domain-containing protein